MEIIKASIDDISEILSIEAEAFSDPRTYEQIQNDITNNPFGIFLIAKIEGIIAGFYNFWITFDSATIYRIATKKKYKRQGIARALLHKGYELMRNGSVEFLTLEVRTSNEAAISLYNSEGFSIITTKKGYYADGEDAYYMIKGLV